MQSQHKAIDKYLAYYAEPEAKKALDLDWSNTYRHCLLIPAYRESAELIERLIITAELCPKLLVILIVNRPDNCQDTECNRELLNRVFLQKARPCSGEQTSPQFKLLELAADSDLLYIDRGQRHPPIPHRQGVGLARKIGADVAAELMTQGIIKANWINASDADTLIPTDYFANTSTVDAEQFAAVVHPFKHVAEDGGAISLPMALYEQRLNHYVDGLRWAGSPYAHHSLGSCLSVSLIHYCQVRGYPKRSGAEDFYLLNKLRKSGDIFQYPMHEMKIISRLSDRVPFGTGPAVTELSNSENPSLEKIFYHPNCFEALKQWLKCAPRFWDKIVPDSEQAFEDELNKFENSELNPSLAAALFAIDTRLGIQHCQKQSKSQRAFERHMLDWFDGFKTLKLIHHLRDYAYPNLSAVELSDSRPSFSSEAG